MDTIKIGYCGKKPEEIDHLYGTNLVWHPGVVHDVPREQAKLLLQHEDVWFDARKKKEREKDPIVAEHPKSPRYEDDGSDVPPPAKVHLMPKADLLRYAEMNFGERLDGEQSEAVIRAQVNRLVNTRT